MTVEEITNGNILIAEFMGLIQVPFKNIDNEISEMLWFSLTLSLMDRFNYESSHSKSLHFHTSWNWLMPVVSKIESTTPHGVLIYEDGCYINTSHDWFECNPEILGDRYIDRTSFEIREELGGNKMNAVWKAVVKFIIWYNKQKNT